MFSLDISRGERVFSHPKQGLWSKHASGAYFFFLFFLFFLFSFLYFCLFVVVAALYVKNFTGQRSQATFHWALPTPLLCAHTIRNQKQSLVLIDANVNLFFLSFFFFFFSLFYFLFFFFSFSLSLSLPTSSCLSVVVYLKYPAWVCECAPVRSKFVVCLQWCTTQPDSFQWRDNRQDKIKSERKIKGREK